MFVTRTSVSSLGLVMMARKLVTARLTTSTVCARATTSSSSEAMNAPSEAAETM